jgi:hypothetical protein
MQIFVNGLLVGALVGRRIVSAQRRRSARFNTIQLWRQKQKEKERRERNGEEAASFTPPAVWTTGTRKEKSE